MAEEEVAAEVVPVDPQRAGLAAKALQQKVAYTILLQRDRIIIMRGDTTVAEFQDNTIVGVDDIGATLRALFLGPVPVEEVDDEWNTDRIRGLSPPTPDGP